MNFKNIVSKIINLLKRQTDVKKHEVYEINLSKKYVIAFSDFIPDRQWEVIQKDIDDWIKSDKPFLMIRGSSEHVKLVKVD